MKTPYFQFLTLLLALGVLAPSPTTTAQQTESWELITTRSDVQLYERWVNLNNGAQVKERKGIMRVDANKEQVLYVLCDASLQTVWMENVSQAFEIRKKNSSQWYSYTAFSLPWPLADRDLVCLSTQKESPGGRTIISMESRPDTWPEKADVQRFQKYRAQWTLHQFKDGSTGITFSAISYEASDFPRFILDPLVRDVFLDNLDNLRELLEKEVGTIAEKGQ